MPSSVEGDGYVNDISLLVSRMSKVYFNFEVLYLVLDKVSLFELERSH